jgi:hypothetical protein
MYEMHPALSFKTGCYKQVMMTPRVLHDKSRQINGINEKIWTTKKQISDKDKLLIEHPRWGLNPRP